ncbi:MAG: LysR family transcriptional regulator [Candidatus Sphingomonas phytovorans]|nr:LysR family transcriptional regulator [Sphingomonas sp.]WEK02248.1 MAG: LysR family transcriptional regulator [Sphingomonas sp.]
MNLRWVVLFAAVGRDRSFTAAAARLNVAQPWISAQIRKLESEIGVQLFHRIKNRIVLTPEGEQLFPIACQVADSADHFRNASRQLDASSGTVVHLGADMPALAVPAFAELNDAFAASHARFSVDVENGSTESLVERLRGGVFDLVCVTGAVDAPGLETIRIQASQPYLLAPRTGPLGKKDGQIASAELGGQRIVIAPAHALPQVHPLLKSALEGSGAEVVEAPETDGRAVAHFAATQGMAAVMIEDVVPPDELLARPLGDAFPGIEHYLVRIRSAVPRGGVERYWGLAKRLHARQGAAREPLL